MSVSENKTGVKNLSETTSVEFKISKNLKKNSASSSVLLKNKTCSNDKLSLKNESQTKKKTANKTDVKIWNEEIKANGFAKCTNPNCNFTSPNITSMQKHYKDCSPVSDKHYCETCKKCLPSEEELFKHQEICNGSKLKTQNKNTARKKHPNKTHYSKIFANKCMFWKKMINTMGRAFCGKDHCNFVGVKLSDLKDHYKSCTGDPEFNSFNCLNCKIRYPNKEALEVHEGFCLGRETTASGKKRSLHIEAIKRLKDSNVDHIIQPGPILPKGQYIRRRPYTKQHKNSWILSFEKFKYVKCLFQNCYFIAMSLEDMIYHFGYCNGDGSFAKYVCPHCNGRVTSEAILSKHIEQSHGEFSVTENDKKIYTFEILKIKNEVVLDEEKIESFTYTEKDLINSGSLLMPASGVEDSTERDNQSYSKVWNSYNTENVSKSSAEQPGSASFFCSKCKKNFLTTEDLRKHISICKEIAGQNSILHENEKFFPKVKSEVLEENICNDGQSCFEELIVGYPVNAEEREINMQSSSNIFFPQANDMINCEKNFENENFNCQPQSKKRGRKSKGTEVGEPKSKINKTEVSCGKCDFKGSLRSFNDHNLRKHVGLGWIQGEKPVDLEDEKEVTKLVKLAFKLTKKGTCESCQDVKKSVMGFITHIQNCGKSKEEKSALRIKCPYCSGSYLKYSLPVHLKLSHSIPDSEDDQIDDNQANNLTELIGDSSGKRKSALKAVSKFQEVLKEDEEENPEEAYFLFKKGVSTLPKPCIKLINAWYKSKRELGKIPCEYKNCRVESKDVNDAKHHHFQCPQLPDEVYFCKICEFYSVEEPKMQTHIITHRNFSRKRKKSIDEIKCEIDEEKSENDEGLFEESDEGEDEDVKTEDEEYINEDIVKTSKKGKRNKSGDSDSRKQKCKRISLMSVVSEVEEELIYKREFCKRGKIENIRGQHFYSGCLNLSLQEELSEIENTNRWPQLHTELKDWCYVSSEMTEHIFPKITESISVSFDNVNKNEPEKSWRRFYRFEGDLINEVPVMFTGGSVQSMSWHKVSFKRMACNPRQYLALTTSKNFDHFINIFERAKEPESSLIQIWDCGVLKNAPASDLPKFSLGIIQEGGRIWDLSWFPEDVFEEGLNKKLSRLGLLVTASEDGVARIWSICDPHLLELSERLPIYKTEPLVKLITDENLEDSCIRITVGKNGIIAGGYANGILAIWNLDNISSPFCKKEGKCTTIKAHLTIQAYRTSIIALSFCPGNNRYVTTGAFEQASKIWDLESPSVPVEQYSKEPSLENIWAKNWPLIIHNYDDIVTNGNKGVVKFFKDALTEKHCTCIITENTCLGMSFSDWLNALCVCTNSGEVKVRFLKSFIQDQKITNKTQSTISSLELINLGEKTQEKGESFSKLESDKHDEKRLDYPVSYEEAVSKYGIKIKENTEKDVTTSKKKSIHPERLPILAANKVCFNPNLGSFGHIAVGYNSGFVRIQYLKELQRNKTLNHFICTVQN